MKTIAYAFLVLLLSIWCKAQTSVLTTGVYSGPTTFYEDPNLNPNWDWELGDVIRGGVPRYYIFLQNKPNAVEEYEAVLPWRQQGSWTGLEDRKKEDGWILLARDFGSPERRLISTNPYFALYNPYRSIIRVFILLLNVPTSFTYSTIELKKQHQGSGILAHLAPVSYATDRKSYMENNATSVAIPSLVESNYWVYGDFPLAYDNTMKMAEYTETPPSMIFDVSGTIMTNITLETDGFSAQGDKKFIQDFMVKNNFGSPGFSLQNGNMPVIDIPFYLDNVNIKATAPNWNSVNNFMSNLKIDLNLGSVSDYNPLKDLFDGFSATLSALSASSPISIAGLDLGGVFKFFVGGGMKPANIERTPPTFISSHYSAKGTMTTTNRFASVTIPIPASRVNYKDQHNGGEVGIINNNPVGIITLIKTPLVYGKVFSVGPLGSVGLFDPTDGILIEYELAEQPQIAVNNSSGLELKKCEISITSKLEWKDDMREEAEWVIARTTATNQRHLMVFESPINEYSGNIESLPVPIQHSKGRTLQVAPTYSGHDLKLKLKATLQRKDDPNAQPVVFIASYNVDLQWRSDLPSQGILPTIPPQNVVATVPSSGGVIIRWEKNREKNIKQYVIERSINGGAYSTVGRTSENSFVDNEIQKAVKAYQYSRVNVRAYYRVKALSEWNDGGIMRSQYSAYSNAADVYGSIGVALSKQGNDSSGPESNFLSQNFPNPFNPVTTIYYNVKNPSLVSLKIYNAVGQEIATIVNEEKVAGYHYAEWDASQHSSGVYYYRIANGKQSETKRMVLMK